MVLVTPAAASVLRSMLKDSRAAAGHAVRLIPDRRGGLSMLIGPPEAGDEIVQESGAVVLIVAAALVARLDSLIFDWGTRETGSEARRDFGLRRPREGELSGGA